MGASVNLKNSVGGFFYTLPLEVHLYNKRLGLEQQGGVVCMKANMCGTPLRRATLSLAGSARFKSIGVAKLVHIRIRGRISLSRAELTESVWTSSATPIKRGIGKEVLW